MERSSILCSFIFLNLIHILPVPKSKSQTLNKESSRQENNSLRTQTNEIVSQTIADKTVIFLGIAKYLFGEEAVIECDEWTYNRWDILSEI
jgi:hypothetical protein